MLSRSSKLCGAIWRHEERLKQGFGIRGMRQGLGLRGLKLRYHGTVDGGCGIAGLIPGRWLGCRHEGGQHLRSKASGRKKLDP